MIKQIIIGIIIIIVGSLISAWYDLKYGYASRFYKKGFVSLILLIIFLSFVLFFVFEVGKFSDAYKFCKEQGGNYSIGWGKHYCNEKEFGYYEKYGWRYKKDMMPVNITEIINDIQR